MSTEFKRERGKRDRPRNRPVCRGVLAKDVARPICRRISIDRIPCRMGHVSRRSRFSSLPSGQVHTDPIHQRDCRIYSQATSVSSCSHARTQVELFSTLQQPCAQTDSTACTCGWFTKLDLVFTRQPPSLCTILTALPNDPYDPTPLRDRACASRHFLRSNSPDSAARQRPAKSAMRPPGDSCQISRPSFSRTASCQGC